jgi:hypothetical protein
LRGFINAISEAAGLEKFVRIGSRILRGGGGLLAMLCGLWVRVIDAVVLLETFVGDAVERESRDRALQARSDQSP